MHYDNALRVRMGLVAARFLEMLAGQVWSKILETIICQLDNIYIHTYIHQFYFRHLAHIHIIHIIHTQKNT